jgi:hypothetical protein
LQSGGVPEEAPSMPSPDSVEFRRSFNAPVMQAGGDVAVGPLLTIKEAAARLKVSAATVYPDFDEPSARKGTHPARMSRGCAVQTRRGRVTRPRRRPGHRGSAAAQRS